MKKFIEELLLSNVIQFEELDGKVLVIFDCKGDFTVKIV